MTENLHRLLETGASQAVINEHMHALLQLGAEERERMLKKQADFEARIRLLERAVWWGGGVIALLGPGFAIVREFMR